MTERKVIRVSAEIDQVVRAYAAERKLEVGEAADKLIATAHSRLTALQKYAGKTPAKKRRSKAG